MSVPPGRRSPALYLSMSAVVFLALTDCDGDPTGFLPGDEPSLTVTGVQADCLDFSRSGVLGLGLLIRDSDGDVVTDPDDVEIEAAVTEVDGLDPTLFTMTLVDAEGQAPDARPLAAAIDIDDSASMEDNDPTNRRAAAAQAFWEAVLPVDPDNEVALFDFCEACATTPGFTSTRLLQDFTRDTDALENALDEIMAFSGSPLYGSVIDVVGFVNTERPAANFRRSILLMSDGMPDDEGLRDDAIAAAQAAGIPVNTVGLGPAAATSSDADIDAVIRMCELASETGGVYASAARANDLVSASEALGQAAAEGQIIAFFDIDPIPDPGSTLRGTVAVRVDGEVLIEEWTFRLPPVLVALDD